MAHFSTWTKLSLSHQWLKPWNMILKQNQVEKRFKHPLMCYNPLAPCVTDINKGFDCFSQTANPSFSVFSYWSWSPRARPICVSPLWMNGGFTRQYSQRTSSMKTFASLTRTHSIRKATVALEGTEEGLIDDKSWWSFFFFLFAPLSKERTELYPLPSFYLLYSTTSFKISPVVLVVLMGEMHCLHNKKK